jgi:two-component system, chemotaxis family, protein-glutamate methylesterase/glutaminase
VAYYQEVSEGIRETMMRSDAKTVLIVNDSVVAQTILAAIIKQHPEYQLLGIAKNGTDGVAKALELKPDLVILDIHMPGLNGVETTKQIMSQKLMRILICSATINKNSTFLFQAINNGALDYVKTPALDKPAGSSVSVQELKYAGRTLIHKMNLVMSISLKKLEPKAKTVLEPQVRASQQNAGLMQSQPNPRSYMQSEEHSRIMALVASTGGPKTLLEVLNNLPQTLPCPLVICQHIDREFVESMAMWLKAETGRNITVAQQRDIAMPNTIYMAKGGKINLSISKGGYFHYQDSGNCLYTPNGDVLLNSLAKNFSIRSAAAVLTGLGNDGAAGLLAMKNAGGTVFAQDSMTSVVYGMPKACVEIGAVKNGTMPNIIGQQLGRWCHAKTE